MTLELPGFGDVLLRIPLCFLKHRTIRFQPFNEALRSTSGLIAPPSLTYLPVNVGETVFQLLQDDPRSSFTGDALQGISLIERQAGLTPLKRIYAYNNGHYGSESAATYGRVLNLHDLHFGDEDKTYPAILEATENPFALLMMNWLLIDASHTLNYFLSRVPAALKLGAPIPTNDDHNNCVDINLGNIMRRDGIAYPPYPENPLWDVAVQEIINGRAPETEEEYGFKEDPGYRDYKEAMLAATPHGIFKPVDLLRNIHALDQFSQAPDPELFRQQSKYLPEDLENKLFDAYYCGMRSNDILAVPPELKRLHPGIFYPNYVTLLQRNLGHLIESGRREGLEMAREVVKSGRPVFAKVRDIGAVNLDSPTHVLRASLDELSRQRNNERSKAGFTGPR